MESLRSPWKVLEFIQTCNYKPCLSTDCFVHYCGYPQSKWWLEHISLATENLIIYSKFSGIYDPLFRFSAPCCSADCFVQYCGHPRSNEWLDHISLMAEYLMIFYQFSGIYNPLFADLWKIGGKSWSSQPRARCDLAISYSKDVSSSGWNSQCLKTRLMLCFEEIKFELLI